MVKLVAPLYLNSADYLQLLSFFSVIKRSRAALLPAPSRSYIISHSLSVRNPSRHPSHHPRGSHRSHTAGSLALLLAGVASTPKRLRRLVRCRQHLATGLSRSSRSFVMSSVFDAYPACSQSCLTSAVASATSCSLLDTACICTNQIVITDTATSCLLASCSTDNIGMNLPFLGFIMQFLCGLTVVTCRYRNCSGC